MLRSAYLFSLICILLCLFSSPSLGQRVVKKVYETGLTDPAVSKFIFYIRYPKSYEKFKAKKGWQPTILLNSHFPISIQGRIEKIANGEEKIFSLYYEISEKYGLPIITYNCPRYKGGYYSKLGNNWELAKASIDKFQQNFLQINTQWKLGLEELCKEHEIECSGFIGVGLSNGAQFISRVAMVQPEMFHSVESILPVSNPTPSPDAKHIYWLRVSGGYDGGYLSCNRFYEKAREAGYERICYIAPHDYGHGSRGKKPDLDKFKSVYYEYLLSAKDKPANTKKFVGDYLNHVVTDHENADWIPENQRVYFSDAQIAKAWGRFIEQ